MDDISNDPFPSYVYLTDCTCEKSVSAPVLTVHGLGERLSARNALGRCFRPITREE